MDKIRSIAEEIVNPELIERLINSNSEFICYNGFEPSGRMHIAQAFITINNIKTLTSLGGKFILYIADYFAFLNHKLGGDMEKINDTANYFIEIFKACGLPENVQIIKSSSFIKEHLQEYFELVMDISSFSTVNQVKNTLPALGRQNDKILYVSHFLYSCMQVADVMLLNVDVAQLGSDQRKVNMLAIEYAKSRKRKIPSVVSHHMLRGLRQSDVKMSKSDPYSAIFIDDDRETIFKKINKAYCPPSIVDNPIYEYVKYIILPNIGHICINGNKYKY